jgi:flagellar basal body-associated protein FliL
MDASALEIQDTMPKSRRLLWAGIGVVVTLLSAGVGVYVWFSLAQPCELSAVEKASMLLIRQRDRYYHSYQFATSASADAIVRPVAELQQILMDTQEVVVPACMQTAKDELIVYMRTVIRAFAAYGAQEADAAVRELIEQSDMHYENFAVELEAVSKCAPFCFP